MSEAEHKQKVLMVHNYYQIPGGEDTVVANEKKLLEEHGHRVVLYTRHNNELKGMSKLQKLALPFTTIFNPRTYRDVKRIIAEENIEIVHVHNTLNLISPAVYYAAVRMRVPVVQTIHNFRFLCPGATFYRDGHICEDCVNNGLKCAVKHKCYRGSRSQTLICVLSTWIHRHTGILRKINYICLTEFNKDRILQIKQIDPENVFIKPNFTFRKQVTNEYAGSLKDFYLYIGRIEEIKGIRVLIEAFRKISEKKIVLAGQGPMKQEYEGKDRNIIFLGQVMHDDLLSILSNAKAVILPSQTYEGFPMVIPEAFSLSIPMIVSDIGNNGILIRDGENGLKYKFDDSNDLVRKIKIFEHIDAGRLGDIAYKEYINKYSPEANYQKLSQIYSISRRMREEEHST